MKFTKLFLRWLLVFLAVTLIFGLNQITSAQIKLTNKDKREIIKLILESRDFTDARESFEDKTPNLSTENIPLAIQKDFPKIKDTNFHLLMPEYIKNGVSIYYFSFGKFRTTKRSVYVWFFENNKYRGGGNGHEHIFQRIKGKWKMVTPKVTRSTAWQS